MNLDGVNIRTKTFKYNLCFGILLGKLEGINMLEYLKFWEFLKRPIGKPFGEGLTPDQKRKYRRQFYDIYFKAFIMSVVFLSGFVYFIGLIFSQNLGYISIAVLLFMTYVQLIEEWINQVDIILERIQRRVKKNKKNVDRDDENESLYSTG